MAKGWDIVYDIDEKDFCLFEKDGVGWKNEGRITAITTTLEVGIVRISLPFGSKKCRLESFNLENPNFQGTSKSRTKFLEAWKKLLTDFQRENQTSNANSHEEQNVNHPMQQRAEHNPTDTDGLISFEIRNTLVGRCIRVHVKNMTAPHPAICLRQIDRKHVDSLKAAFRKRPENNNLLWKYSQG